MDAPLLRMVDAVTLTVPDLDRGLACYVGELGHELIWRDDALGRAGLRCPDADTEIVLATDLGAEPTWLVRSVDEAVAAVVAAGGRPVAAPTDIPVGRVAVVADPFGNRLVLVDLSKGRYRTDEHGSVVGVDPPEVPPPS